MKKHLALAVSIGLAMSSAHGVMINPRGTGQVLVYPYYTVNAGQATLFSIINSTNNGKAVKIRFHEGYNGRDVYDLNVYLSPMDVWVGQLSASGMGGDSEPASLSTNDNSCTVPAFAPGQGGAATKFMPTAFTADSFSGDNADGGPASLTRTREGHFEVFEMGEVTDAVQNTLSAISHIGGVPTNCNRLTTAWSAGGYWNLDPTVDIGPPTGGLYGEESIINVANGTMFGINAIAIDSFRSESDHTDPTSAAPDLNSAAESGHATVTADIPVNGHMIKATYSSPIDAVSALFMTANLYNEYVILPSIGAQSDWIVTFPTKRFYVDTAIIGDTITAHPPFDAVFGDSSARPGSEGTSCSEFSPVASSREEDLITNQNGFGGTFPKFFCYDSNAVTFNTADSLLGSKLTTPETPPQITNGINTGSFQAGQLSAGMTIVGASRELPVSAEGFLLQGLPAVGFLAVQYVNGQVLPGVLSNYNAAFPHRTRAICTLTVSPVVNC